MVIDEVMQVLVPLVAQLTYFSEPEQEYGASFRHLTVPRQFAPTEIVDPPDAIDLPNLEVRDLDDVWPGVGHEGYRAIEKHPNNLVQCVELPLELVPHEEGVLPQLAPKAGWA